MDQPNPLKLPSEFRDGLRRLINVHSIDAATNTPDYILADMLSSMLRTFHTTVTTRDEWHNGGVLMTPERKTFIPRLIQWLKHHRDSYATYSPGWQTLNGLVHRADERARRDRLPWESAD